jgi:hypothetical protein
VIEVIEERCIICTWLDIVWTRVADIVIDTISTDSIVGYSRSIYVELSVGYLEEACSIVVIVYGGSSS